jgi:hypothetical protein
MKSPGLSLGSPSLSVHYLRMKFSQTDKIISTGTGFIYLYEDIFYLITNGHNVTGVNPETKKRLSQHAGIPDIISTKAKTQPSEYSIATIPDLFYVNLYKDGDINQPLWYVHPKHSYNVDVVAIPIISKTDVPGHVKLFAINEFDISEDIYPMVSDDVFVLGFPFNITDNLELPIWKRGSVATEPGYDIENLPKLYIDTATRAGMSGSPVIFKRTGLVEKAGYKKSLDLKDLIIGTVTGFLGIYSGRIGADDEFGAQLGIVWREEVILEILKSKTIGTCEFQGISDV